MPPSFPLNFSFLSPLFSPFIFLMIFFSIGVSASKGVSGDWITMVIPKSSARTVDLSRRACLRFLDESVMLRDFLEREGERGAGGRKVEGFRGMEGF